MKWKKHSGGSIEPVPETESEGFPHDIITDEDGNPIGVRTIGGEYFPFPNNEEE